MFRNSAWFLCAFLLCFGQTLSQNDVRASTPQGHEEKSAVSSQKDMHVAPETHEVKTPAVLPKENVPVSAPETHEEKSPAVPPTAPHSADPATHSESDLTPKPEIPNNPEPKPTPTPTKPPTTPTTKPPVTSSSSTASTTSKPTPTPSPTPTTSTPIPVTPTPPPQKGSWNVTNKNITCLRIDGIFSIDFTYQTGNKTNKTDRFVVPKGAKSKGSCEEITLYWAVSNTTNELAFIFKKENNVSYSLHSFAGSVYIQEINKTERFNTNTNKTYFETPIGQSYSCSSMRTVDVNHAAKVTLDEFHIQAFKTSNNTGFDTSKDCAETPPHTADIVPIVVGCVLALLVIAVLVAYLISRRRSQTRGYLSM